MNAAPSHAGSHPLISGLLRPAWRRAEGRIGAVVAGKYRLERLLGAGGMAHVYSAVHLRNGSRVAIKMLHDDLSADGDLCARFVREGRLANAVDHPGVVRVLDDDSTEDGARFLVMELLEGEPLDARCARNGGRLDLAEVVRILSGVLQILAAAHAKGIVHRDVKPENVFLTADGAVKLLDFGIAKEAETCCNTTIPGTVMGTPGFMSPEQALGHNTEVDALSDIYSVGATAFALLSGRLVHPGQTSSEVLARTALIPASSLTTVAPQVPRAVAQVVDRALAFERCRRWQSATSMHDALVAAARPARQDVRPAPSAPRGRLAPP